MKIKIVDDRTPEQKKTHVNAIVACDKFMSGWGGAAGGTSRCAWSYDPSTTGTLKLYNWVKGRSEMRYVNQVDLRKYRAPRGTAHFHIYVAGHDHPAFR